MYYYNHAKFLNNSLDSESGANQRQRFTDYKVSLRQIIKDKLINTNASSDFYKVLHKPSVEKYVSPYIEIAKHIREIFDAVLIIGIGGAALNPEAVLNLVQKKSNTPKIYFLDTTDPIHFDNLLNNLDLGKTFCIVISNSGQTIETISLAKSCLASYKQANLTNYKQHFLFITGEGSNKLRELATQNNILIYEHERNISGRYAGLTSITALPGLIAGINIEDFMAGASEVIQDFWQQQEESIVAEAALEVAISKKPIVVNIAYLKIFSPFLEWYCQIIAESLGKEGVGITPVRGLGPNDQHTLLQLYLDGPQDKLFTMFNVKQYITKDSYITHNLHKVNDICFAATLNALESKGLPVRVITLDELSPKSVGALMAHCMLEVILLGHIFRINPFNQPGVQLIKTNAQKLLDQTVMLEE